MKKLLSMLLSLVMMITVIPLASISKPITAQAYSNGDHILYGSYPQSAVTDSALKTTLKNLVKDGYGWRELGWASGKDQRTDNSYPVLMHAYYRDVLYNGVKYRALIYGSDVRHGNSTTNGYPAPSSGYNYYFFKWEPLSWKVVENTKLLCDKIIYSDSYANALYVNSDGKYYSSKGKTTSDYYIQSWARSVQRHFLTYDFIDEAFTPSQKANIAASSQNNNSVGGNTNDKVYLTSPYGAKQSSWGFVNSNNADANRIAQGTDYAKACGVSVNSSGNSGWWLRSADETVNGTAYDVVRVTTAGAISKVSGISEGLGCRPVIALSTVKADSEINLNCLSNLNKNDEVYFGNYPQSKVTGTSLISSLASASKTWRSYRYFTGTGNNDGKMQGSDIMEYADFVYSGQKYRAVKINRYRPLTTADEAGNPDLSKQDDNNYSEGNIYYFKYEPLKWTVIDPDTQTLMCSTLIDAQPYQSMVYGNYRSISTSDTASNYSKSNIRTWLNNTFMTTAFNTHQKSALAYMTVTHGATSSSLRTTTTDRVMLPTRNQAEYASSAYSDYAACMGLNKGNGANALTDYATGAYKAGTFFPSSGEMIEIINVNVNGNGICPVISISNLTDHNYVIDNTYLPSVEATKYTLNVGVAYGEGGTVTGAGTTYAYGEAVNVSATPDEGYTFKCWLDKSGNELPTSTYPQNWFTVEMTGNTRYTAEFAPNKYDLTLTAGTGGTISRDASSWYTGTKTFTNFNYNGNYYIYAKPDYGYRFDHWENLLTGKTVSTSTANNCAYSFTAGKENKYKAVFTKTYKVTGVSNNTSYGTVAGGGTYDENAKVTLTATPKSGYKVGAWYEDQEQIQQGGNTYTISKLTADRGITCAFVPIPNYTVTLTNTAGGVIVSGAGSYTEGATCTAKAQANSGYTFIGWYEGSTLMSSNLTYSFTVTKNITLQAKFSQKTTYNVSVTADPAAAATVYGSGKYEAGGSSTLRYEINEGYSFSGWYENGSRISAADTYTITVNNNRTITAKFIKQYYTITTVADPADGGYTDIHPYQDSGPISLYYGENVVINASAKPGYVFVGWYDGDELITDEDEFDYSVAKAETFTAKFVKKSYTIRIVPQEGGTIDIDGQPRYNTYKSGDTVNLHATPDAGYTFNGWYYAAIPNPISTELNYSFTASDTNTNAVWTPKFTKITYTISAVSEDEAKGTVSGGGTYEYNDDVMLFAEPADGYSFDGWYDGNTKVSSDIPFVFKAAAAKNYTAKFTKNTYAVSVSANPSASATVTGGGTYEHGSTATVKAEGKSGYIFKGWYEGDTLLSTSETYAFTVKAEVELEARYDANDYAVKASASPAEGGTVTGSGNYKYGLDATVVATANKGYTFSGWYEGSTKVSSNASYTFTVTAAKTLTAKFKKNTPAPAPDPTPAPAPITDLTPGKATPKQVEQFITNLPDDKDPKGSTFETLLARKKKTTKSTITLTFKKPKGVSYYIIYGNRCGKGRKYEYISKTTKTSYTVKKVNGAKLKKGTYHKFLVCAFSADDKLVATSVTIHATTTGGKKTDAKAVTTAAKKNKVTLKKGKTFKLKAKQVAAEKKKKIPNHRKIKFKSTNTKVATVSAKGVIKAKKKGTCYVYVFAQNGVYKKIKVTVK